jgi:hypothetical protein
MNSIDTEIGIGLFKINYDRAYKNNFRCNVSEAVKFYLSIGSENCGEDSKYGVAFMLYPQALNPFLKIMETLNETKNIVILPAFDNDYNNKLNKPAYFILKLPLETKYIDMIGIENL